MSVWRAAEFTVGTLRRLGFKDICLIGGAACNLYGNDREPMDVDVIILNWSSARDRKTIKRHQEAIKQRLVGASKRFYLVDSQTRGAQYQVLWYHPLGEGSNRRLAAVKIDILLPGITEIPAFDPSRIRYSTQLRLPVAPLSLVLLHKLQGWFIRSHSPNTYQYEKHWKDSFDVARLVPIAAKEGVKITDPALSNTLVEKAREWVDHYVMKYPEFRTAGHWRKIGFGDTGSGGSAKDLSSHPTSS